jgi:hypothetical protein
MISFEKYKEIIITDLSKKTNYSSWGAGYYEGLTEGCLIQHDFTEEEKEKLLELVRNHFKKNYTWTGKLKKKLIFD